MMLPKSIRRMTRLAVAAGIAALVSASANASVVTTYANFGPFTVPPAHLQTLSFAKFNTALGTLTGVMVTITSTGTPSLTITNPTGSPVAYSNAQAQYSSLVSAPGLSGSDVQNLMFAGPAHGSGTQAASSTSSFSPGTVTVTNSGAVAPASFNFYKGVGSLTLNYRAGVYFQGSPKPPLIFGGSDPLSGRVTITYTYTPSTVVIPEPATIVALGSGLACLGLVRLRRKTA